MDNGNGHFIPITEKEAILINKNVGRDLAGIFRKGEIITIRNSKFRVERIKTRSLRLLLLPNGYGE